MLRPVLEEISLQEKLLSKAVLSAPGKKDPALPFKIVIVKKEKGGDLPTFSAEEFIGQKTFHKSLSRKELDDYILEKSQLCAFRQIGLFTEEKEISFRISKKGKIARSVNTKNQTPTEKASHNREKNYLIREGDAVPFMVDLGVFTKEGKVVAAKYDKFRQINRFIEIVDHAFADFEKDEITVLDFGCGKSYLTFFIYYYFAVLKKKRVHITGYDLKADVVEHCNLLAKKYGYHGLRFVVADVTRDVLSDEKIDFVISLHACDIATDFALNYALEKDVPYIFSVPCCQHEINSAIKKGGGDLDPFLSHGIFKERMSALLTDVIRTEILEAEGYRVDVLEFVDFAHSPKNLMLRAKKKKNAGKKNTDHIEKMEQAYGFTQTLYHLRKGEKHDG
ncbi:MAG: SAM-dependent methyltransferase [Ruminococcaceae bacterium]|nr:SAM-dependent methyltransferase [Oscillospiraceae bacterium]